MLHAHRGCAFHAHRTPDAQRGTLRVVPAIDVVEDDRLFPACVVAAFLQEPSVVFQRNGVKSHHQRVRLLKVRRDFEARAAEHALVSAEFDAVEPDGAAIANALEDQPFPRRACRLAKCRFEPPGLVAGLGDDELIAANGRIR